MPLSSLVGSMERFPGRARVSDRRFFHTRGEIVHNSGPRGNLPILVDMGIGRLLLLTTSYQDLVQPARLNFISGVGPAGRGWICKGARGGAGQLLRRAGIIAHFGLCQLARKEVDARGIVISSAMKKFYALERGAQYVKSVALDSIPFVCVPLKKLLHD